MTINSTDSKQKHPFYPSFEIRFLMAIGASIYIIVEGQKTLSWALLTDPNIYITLLFSVAIAVALIEYINATNRLFDRYLPWEEQPNKRLAFQLTCCALIPITFDLYLIKSFFWLFLYDYEKSRYATSEFPLVKLLIYLLNYYYYSQYKLYLQSEEVPVPVVGPLATPQHEPDQNTRDEVETSNTFTGNLGPKTRVFHVNDLQCFQRESGTGKAWLSDGSVWLVAYRTDEFEKMLDPKLFFKINRNVIMAFKVIESYQNSANKKGSITLKQGIDYTGSKVISRELYPHFKMAFRDYIERMYTNT